MSFSVLVWNVQKFRGESQARIDDVVDHIRAADPDIFGIMQQKNFDEVCEAFDSFNSFLEVGETRYGMKYAKVVVTYLLILVLKVSIKKQWHLMKSLMNF